MNVTWCLIWSIQWVLENISVELFRRVFMTLAHWYGIFMDQHDIWQKHFSFYNCFNDIKFDSFFLCYFCFCCINSIKTILFSPKKLQLLFSSWLFKLSACLEYLCASTGKTVPCYRIVIQTSFLITSNNNYKKSSHIVIRREKSA